MTMAAALIITILIVGLALLAGMGPLPHPHPPKEGHGTQAMTYSTTDPRNPCYQADTCTYSDQCAHAKQCARVLLRHPDMRARDTRDAARDRHET